MRLRNSALLQGLWLTLAAALVLPGEAMAAWGNENWGTMVWGQGASLPVLPALGIVGLTLLGMSLAGAAAWTLRKSRPALGATLMLVVLAIPLAVAAGTVGQLETFVNGEVADADQVNTNFDAIETAVNDNDSRLLAVETDTATALSTADTALADAAAAQAEADAAVVRAATALSTADAAAAGHTVDTNTQLSNAEVAAAATAEGFVTGAHTTDTNTQLDEAQVDGFVANNGFGLAADVSANTAAIAANHPVPASRFEDCGDGTVADHDTGLLWEEKTGTVGNFVNCTTSTTCPNPHDVNNIYAWSASGSTAPDGLAYTDFLGRLNGTDTTTDCFASHCNWRLPTIGELRQILVGPDAVSTQTQTCSSTPCIDPGFAAVGGPTWSLFYWSASSHASFFPFAWFAIFSGDGGVGFNDKTDGRFVRAVRAGSCD